MILYKLNTLFVFVFILFGNEVLSQKESCSQENTRSEQHLSLKSDNKNRISHIDLLMNNLKHEHWESDENVCYEKILNIMRNVKNSTLWATWNNNISVWDSMQSSTGLFFGSRYNFGHFDQCVKAPWLKTRPEYRTQYCLADITLFKEELKKISIDPDSSVDVYTKSVSKHGVTFNELTLGVCVPAECRTRSIEKFVKVLFADGHLGRLAEARVAVGHCQRAGAAAHYGAGYCAAMCVRTFFLGTIVTIIVCNILKDETSSNSNSIGGRLLDAVHLYTNMAYLTRSDEDDIKIMHGIRALTCMMIVILHVWFVTLWITPGNSLQIDIDMADYGLTKLYHSEVLVDTFIMMSGLLLMRGIMKIKNFNPLVMIAKRYLRLLWITGLFLLFASNVLIYVGSGPLFTKLAKIEKSACDKNWWANLLMLGNYIDTTNMCYPVLWTIPCDFHLTIVGVTLYWIYTKNERVGISLFSITFLLGIIMPGVYTYQHKLPPAPLFNIKNIREYRKTLFANPTYMWSHFRSGPYFVGIIAGYILSKYKPMDHRNIIPKRWSVIGFCTALFTASKVVTMGSAFHDDDKPYDALDSAIFVSLNRSIWGVAVAAIIMICEYGTVPLMNTFFTWNAFVPISKLSYGVYLVHTMVFSFVISTIRTPFTYNIYVSLLWSFGVLVMSNIISLLLHIFLEAPMAKTLNIFVAEKRSSIVQKRKHSKSKNGFRHEEAASEKKIL